MTRVLVTGANGFAGRYICKELALRGYIVFGLLRKVNVDPPFTDHPEVTLLQGDLSNADVLFDLLRKNEIVHIVHAAAVVSDWGPKEVFYEVNVNGTKKLLDASRRAMVKSFLYISTIDVLDYRHGKHTVLSEATPYTSSSYPYPKTKLLGELAAIGYSKYFKVIVLRPAWLFGPGDKTLVPEIIHNLKEGFLLLPGKRDTYIPLLYVENLARFVRIVFNHLDDLANGTKINLSDPEKITWRQFAEFFKPVCNTKAKILNIPYTFGYVAAVFFESYYRLLRKKTRPLITRSSLSMVTSSLEIEDKLMRRYLGNDRVGFDYAMKQTVEWFNVHYCPQKAV